jgi:hypothetical protein
LTVFSAGLEQLSAPGWVTFIPRGSDFVYTNGHGTIQKQDSYVDSWGAGAVTSCNGAVGTAGAALVAFGGSSCPDLVHAKYSLAATNMGLTQAVTQGNITINGTSTQCLLFTLAGNTSGATPFYINEPIDFLGVDTNPAPKLRMFGLYWVVGAASNVLALSPTVGGPCINEAANINNSGTAGTAALYNDIGFDSILLQCNASLGCTTSNPETFLESANVSMGLKNFYAKSSYLSLLPDTATPGKVAVSNPTTSSVSIIQGANINWFSNPAGVDQGGRIRDGVASIDTTLNLTAAVPIGPIPYFSTPISGALVAAGVALPGGAVCPTGHQCETLTFAAVLDQASRAVNGAKYQAADAAGSPGEGIVVNGTGSTGASWDCGTSATVFCNVIDSTTTTVSFVNDAASG